jgi:hypothetical protein
MTDGEKTMTKRYRVRCVKTSLNSGSPRRFAIEVYEPRSGRFPWVGVEVGFETYDDAAARLRAILGVLG